MCRKQQTELGLWVLHANEAPFAAEGSSHEAVFPGPGKGGLPQGVLPELLLIA